MVGWRDFVRSPRKGIGLRENAVFKLLRYYSVASAVTFFVVVAATAAIYRSVSLGEMIHAEEQHSAAPTRSSANMLWPKFGSYVTSMAGATGSELRARPETGALHRALSVMTEGLPVLKVKIYDLGGLTVYSSQASQIGESKADNDGFRRSSKLAQAASKLSFRDTFSAFSGEVLGRSVVESYVPLAGADGTVLAVFEIYADVTEAVARIQRGTLVVTMMIVLLLAVLYLTLLAIVWRADRVLGTQYSELQRRGGELRRARNELEHRVEERTKELRHEIAERRRVEVALVEARDQAECASRAKSMFLANMSHELRTPLNSIIGFSEVMSERLFGPLGHDKYASYVQDIRASGTHLLALINNVLDVSRIEAGTMELVDSDLDIVDVVGASLRMVAGRAERNGISFCIAVPPDAPRFKGDEVRMKQIIVNLLANAVKFTPEGGLVEIGVRFDDDRGMTCEVRDTGIGIAAEDIPRVMKPFEQVRTGYIASHEGSGLGLYLAKSLTEMHDGELRIEREVGTGTTVTLWFPPDRTVATPVARRPDTMPAFYARA